MTLCTDFLAMKGSCFRPWQGFPPIRQPKFRGGGSGGPWLSAFPQVCNVSDAFGCIAIVHSGTWAAEMANTYATLTLFSLQYEVAWVDGSLCWSRITGLRREGTLYEPGMRKPMFQDKLSERRRQQRGQSATSSLRSGDPLAQRSVSGRGNGRKAPSAKSTHRGARATQPPAQPRAAASDNTDGAIVDVDAPTAAPHRLDGNPEGEDFDMVGGAHDEVDVFDVGVELAGLIEEDLVELGTCYGEDAVASGQVAESLPEAEARAPTVVPPGLEDALADEVAQSGLEETPLETERPAPQPLASGSGGAGSSGDALPPPPEPHHEPVTVKERLGVTGPSEMGYVYHNGKGRPMLRILRGNPRGSVSVRCYQHTGCSFLLTLASAPCDDDLIEWGFEVPPALEDAPASESKALGEKHKRLADKWRPKKAKAAAKAASGR